ncbi:MAG TPA: hypothetical protein DEB47_07755 [Citreicella sp.]|nr:hypothetical protein [Citreicella sp.]
MSHRECRRCSVLRPSPRLSGPSRRRSRGGRGRSHRRGRSHQPHCPPASRTAVGPDHQGHRGAGRSGKFANRARLPSERDLAEPLAQNEDIALFPRTDDTFHHRIASIAQAPLTHVVPELPEDQRRMSRSPPEALSRAMEAHRQMVEAIRDRAEDRAEAAMRAHLTVVVQTYSDIREEAADPAD